MKSEILSKMEEAMAKERFDRSKPNVTINSTGENDLESQSVLSESEYNELDDQQENSKDLVDELAATAQDREEFLEAQKAVKEVVRNLKRRFKGLSKRELIHVIVEQISRADQYQKLAQKYFEDNKKLLDQLESK